MHTPLRNTMFIMYNIVLVSELCFLANTTTEMCVSTIVLSSKLQTTRGRGGGCTIELACGLELFLVQYIVVEVVASSFNTS